ncbi:hypothetical protein [Acidicapsa ligni]|uniref:hypothetical protein n=1 Tax=Acidicapsa ligni TaxID=542300 RepID=UPI0021E062C0|nr:hypothetical protein [Acidicapsa ligni]
MTVEQLEAARAERMRQNGHGAITLEDVRTWIEETGLCIFLPRSAQAGFTAPTFVEAVAGQRTTEPTLELITTAENLLVRLEADGVAVRLNLAGLPGDQPDYVVAGWVLPYIYALRGDRDWRRSPQLTGSRQVSQLAVHAAKQLDSANMNAAQIRDALGREVTESAVLRALHELWKQLRIIPVVPEVGQPALWQPLRQRFQKAIAEGASTSQVTAISVLASIYLQAVIAGSMEDVELFLSPLTSRSKIREVVRGLAATRQVHSTTMGHSPMFYVAGTLPEFPTALSYQISNGFPAYPGQVRDEDELDSVEDFVVNLASNRVEEVAAVAAPLASLPEAPAATVRPPLPATPSIAQPTAQPMAQSIAQSIVRPAARIATRPAGSNPSSSKSPAPRPRPSRSANAPHPRERSHGGSSNSHDSRSSAPADRRRAPAARGTSANGNASRSAAAPRSSNSSQTSSGRPAPSHNGSGTAARFAKPLNGNNGSGHGKPAHGKPTHGKPVAAGQRSNNGPSRTGSASNGSTGNNSAGNGARGTVAARPANARPTARPDTRPSARSGSESGARPTSRSASGFSSGNSAPRGTGTAKNAKPAANGAKASAAKRYSFTGQAKQAPKPAAKAGSKPAAKTQTATRSRSASASSRPAAAKRRG